jgi:hypothetical protein
MEKHREMDEVFNEGDVRNRSGDGRNAIGKEGELFPSLGNGDIPIDRIFIMDDI